MSSTEEHRRENIGASIKAIIGVLLLAGGTGCASPELQAKRAAIQQDWPAYEEIEALRYSPAGFSGKTVMTPSVGQATQVVSVSPDGSAYLLYPGNRSVVPSLWKTSKSILFRKSNLCWKYPTNSYNPATATFGGSWDCRPISEYSVMDYADGDVFNLSGRRLVPFRLSSEMTSIERLLNESRTTSLEPNARETALEMVRKNRDQQK